MRYNKYTSNTPNVSEIGVGAWQLGVSKAWKSISEKEAIDLVHRALELGINFFDTAPNYGLGTSEERLGKALKNVDRDKIVINTKFGHSAEGKLDFESGSIRESLEGSLRRLQTDYVDSIIIHNPPFEYLDGSRTDHYEIFEKLKDEGKLKAYGASLDTYEEMKLLMETTESKVIEAFFNILHQNTAKAFKLAKEKEVGIIVKIPLDSGWLSGKYNADTEFEDIRKRWTAEDKKTRAGLVGRVRKIIPEEYSLPQAAISFCLAYEAVSTVIPGNKSIEQLDNNFDSVNHSLPKEVVEELEKFFANDVERLRIPW